MNDEIKEILEKPNVYSFNDECYLYFGDYNKLKDYITNLQHENESLKKDRKYLLQYYNEDYKSRIEKAVEYINNNLLYSEDFDYDEEDNLVWQGARCDTQSEDLLNILNGRSDE